jgi:uncharacterized protein (TIGR02646 family)
LAAFSIMEPQPDFGIFAFQDCKDEIRDRLVKNQHHQCAYCERPIEDEVGSFHLDHVKSQHEAPTRRFDITNLVASCETASTCGRKHDSNSVPDELHPYLAADLHLAFHCSSLGELSSSTLSAMARQFAFEDLNLNDPGLKSQRAKIMATLMQYTIAAGTNARKKLKDLPTRGTGFMSLYAQLLGRFGYAIPA